MSETSDGLRNTIEEIERGATKKSRDRSIGKWLLGGGAALGVGALGVLGFMALPSNEANTDGTTLETSTASTFPEDEPVSDRLQPPSSPLVVERRDFQAEQALQSQIDDLQAALTAAEERLAAQGDATESERVLEEQVATLQDQLNAEREAAALKLEDTIQDLAVQADARFASYDQQIEQMGRQLDAAKRQNDILAQAPSVDPLEQDRLALERQQLALEQQRLDNELILERERVAANLAAQEEQRRTLEQRRAEARAAEEARVSSPMVAVGNGGSGGANNDANARELSPNEAFLSRAVEPVQIARAERIVNPHATVPAGTSIQAALETAIDSTLPGAIRAIVSEDVYSLDGSAILIPAGSKVIGEYSSGIALGQRRILVVWTQIMTPNHRVISISSVGADQLGRSGTSGAVDTRFGERFLGAAAVSIIGAGPAIAASRVADENTAEIIEDVGNDFSSASSNALGEILSIPPTIYVRQGERVTIFLDRHVEVF